ncbi:HlyD family secretion protein [Photobacterium kishitanii]|uniref:Secretion protein HlyD n=1 Tax=Photobacterium kishitanii TaxID=318456 RepID=A0A2T3KIX4_9GAMM|nr:HlyD family efflux transporter periplasmic adaptor subunit [Photobacterium kishitanii]PSU84573.1 secretion protein HlyD [Photobacterium kishitanii]PSU90732.1 secretion protein HlyD [Photobacterium kishitanii]PSU99210.1 secretion protein HlyD [Photobacterium kishitanii]PSW59749.1 secretion protein HlyD [Photobacterium kishitanii]
MVARGKHLYRPEYFEAQKVTSEGRILLNASFNQNIYLCLSMLVLIAIVTFITLAEYTRRETLVGLVSPLEGMVKVQANDSGYIEQIFVKEGDKVENLTPLYEIKTERFDDSGIAVKQRILVSIENQYQLLVERRQQESVKANLERQALVEDITRLDIESGILKNLLKLSNHELKLTHLLANKQKTLLKNHFLSDYDYQKIQLDLLSKQSKTESHNLNLQKLLREKQNRITSLKNKDISLDITLKDLDRQLEAMMQTKVEFLSKGDSQVRSPIKGIIASILANTGHSVTNGQPLLVIVPESDKTFVELYAPSRSIGFMKVGQKVRLRFDAFPYEKFGAQVGTITSISTSAVAPEMIVNRRLINNAEVEGLYQARIELSKPTITVYGREERLISGMTVVADVELDTRKIYEWILEPFYTIKGKV